MRWQTLASWAVVLWIAGGMEAALGGGLPGPLWLLPVAAGLATGIPTGLAVGICAGVLGAALGGGGLTGLVLLYGACGAGAGVLPRWVARRNVAWAMVAALVGSALIAVVLGLTHGARLGQLLPFALLRGGQNALWMLVIYSIVLVVYARRAEARRRWE